MATTDLTIGNELLTTTMHILMKDWRDNVHESVAFLDAQERVHGTGKPVQSGGSRIVVPLASVSTPQPLVCRPVSSASTLVSKTCSSLLSTTGDTLFALSLFPPKKKWSTKVILPSFRFLRAAFK